MTSTRRRLAIATAACGCSAVLASVFLHRETLRDHAEGWASAFR